MGGSQLAHAAPGEIRLALEPGAATLRAGSKRHYGGAGGASLSLGLTARARLALHADFKRLPNDGDRVEIGILGGSLVYCLDVLALTPFVELGVAQVHLRQPEERFPREYDGLLGLGFDANLGEYAFWGLVIRYYGYFEVPGSNYLSDAAYTTINARLGFVIGGL